MGGLTEPEREAFLFSLPLARRQEILDLQFRWESDTESALNMAIRSLYQRR